MSCNVDTDKMRKDNKRHEEHMQKINEMLSKIISLQERLVKMVGEEAVKVYNKEGEK
jgi:predicted ATP-grasp superfamily ATP-dependent carboligase